MFQNSQDNTCAQVERTKLTKVRKRRKVLIICNFCCS